MIKLPERKVKKASEMMSMNMEQLKLYCCEINAWNACVDEYEVLNATAQPVSDGWVKCSESMPEEMSDVLVTDGKDVKDMWWNGKKWDSWADRYSLDSDSITHWMPKPSAPGGQDS